MEEIIEELDDEDFEVEAITKFDLSWTCKECGANNCEYDIPFEEKIICECEECGKKYKAYYCPY